MKKILILITTITIIAGCSKSYLSSLQNNPNAPTTDVATPQLILPGTITGLVNVLYNSASGTGAGCYESEAVWLGYWNYQPGYTYNSTVGNYIMTAAGPQLWDQYYGVLTNLNVLLQQSSSVANSNYRDIANIMEAICFQNLVDLYNDIPYSQALQGSGEFYPKYDNASDIYDSLTAKLDVVIADINANLTNAAVNVPANDDVMFGGNMQNWLLFANTVKLRLLVTESNVSAKQAYITSEVGKTATLGFLTSDALVNPGYSTSKPNQIWASFGTSPSGGLNGGAGQISGNQTAIDFYTATNDVRLGYFYTPKGIAATSPSFSTVTLPITFSNYVDDYLGSQNSIAGGSSDIGSGIAISPSQSALMMSAAESYFYQAEATLYGWLPGGAAAAQTLYQNGITKSYEYLNVGGSASAADGYAAAYYGQNIGFVAFPTGASTDSLTHTIIEQRWAALNSITPNQPYNDWRRTYNAAMNSGYPIVPVSINNSNSNPHMPFRYLYPTEEQNNNDAAWTAAGGATINPFTSKIFWMQ